MNNLSVKKVTSSEIEKLQTIARKTFYETFSPYNSEKNMKDYLDESFSSEKLNAELTNENSEFYFATQEDTIVGYLKINSVDAQTEMSDGNSLEIERIYVLQEFHGKNVGKYLYDVAFEKAKQKNVDFIWLGVWENNSRAINFYKKLGFTEFDRHVFKIGDDVQTDIMMKLRI